MTFEQWRSWGDHDAFAATGATGVRHDALPCFGTGCHDATRLASGSMGWKWLLNCRNSLPMIPMPFLFFASFIWKQCNSERTRIPSQGCPSLGGDPSGSTIVTTIYCFFPKPPWCSFATKPEIRQRTPPHPAWCPALQEACGAMEALSSPQIGMGEKLSWQLEWTGNTK